LACSRSFVDYSTSGLENPLLFLLLALFSVQFLCNDNAQRTDTGRPNTESPYKTERRSLLIALLLSSFAFTTRPDSLLLTTPAVAYLAYQARGLPRRKLAIAIAVGLSPAIAWELFSLFYYGFPLPNTAYAKLDTGIARSALARQAGWYYLNSLRWDPLTLSTIAAGLAVSIFGGIRQRLMAAGVALFLLYLFYIGGDFMSGRFFAAPLLVCTLLLCLTLETRSARWFTTVAAVALMATSPSPTLLPPGERDLGMEHDIADERGFYFADTGMIHYRRGEPYPSHPWFRYGRRFKDSQHPFAINRFVGFFGFAAGPDRIIIDPMGLTDPLLSRLPVSDPHRWRIGHFQRVLPEGFIESLRSGDNSIVDPALRDYYGHLRTIARGPLWSAHRLRTIALFNLGHYDNLLDAYLER
jgi:arabinofuranosyltransferase